MIMSWATGRLGKDSVITLKTYAAGTGVHIEFKHRTDPEAQINPELLFLPFDEGGLGFGLSQSYRYMKNMGGFLSYSNENGFTIFTVTLPCSGTSSQERTDIQDSPLLPPKQSEQPAEKDKYCFDSKTGVLSANRFPDFLERKLTVAVKNNRPLSLIRIDIDALDVSDVAADMGRAESDLIHVVQILDKTLSAPDRIIAGNGDYKFTAVLPDSDLEEAFRIAESMRSNVEALNLSLPNGTGDVPLTVSLGAVSTVPNPKTAGKDIIEAAARALSLAKEKGGNKVVTVTMYDDQQ